MGLSAVLVLAVERLGHSVLECPLLYLGPRSMNCLEQGRERGPGVSLGETLKVDLSQVGYVGVHLARAWPAWL